MENPNYEQVVKDAAKWLDGVEPGWWRKIDREWLDISSCRACIVGQLFGYFDDGLCRLGLIRTPHSRWARKEPWAIAFTSDDDKSDEEKTNLWRSEIFSRLEADKANAGAKDQPVLPERVVEHHGSGLIPHPRDSKSADAFIARTTEIINQPKEYVS